MRGPEEKRPLRMPRSEWEDNTKMDLEEIMVWYILDYVGHSMDQWKAYVNTATNILISLHVENFLSSYATYGFRRRAQSHGVIIIIMHSKRDCDRPCSITTF
jgi:hypothetical protein